METLVAGNQTRRADDGMMEDWLGVALWIVLILLVVGSVIVVGSGSWAQTTDSGPSSGTNIRFQSGQVTASQGTTIQINNQNYPLHEEVAITDDEGKPRGQKDLVPGTEVKFHVRRGSIDKIIVILPK